MNATVNEYQSSPARRSSPRRGRPLALSRERLVLVVQRLVAARAQNRLAQPLQPEDEQERADDEPQRVDRNARAGPSTATISAEHDRGGADADQRRTPAAHDAHAEHDRQRLDRLHGTGEERREKEEEVMRHRRRS